MPDPTTPEDLKTLIDEQARLVKALREENERLLSQGKNTQQEWTEKMQALQTRLDEIEVKLRRPPLDVPVEAAPDVAEASKAERLPGYLRKWLGRPAEERRAVREAFALYCRKGLLGPDQVKLLTVGDDTTGGYLATPEMTSEMLKGVVEFSPIRAIASVRGTSARSVKIRKRTGTFAAVWAKEAGTKTETTGLTYGLEEVPVHELYAYVKVTNEDLEDADFNLEAELAMEAAEQFGVAEGAAFVNGNAVGKPEGLLTNAAVGTTNSGHATQVTADGLLDLFHAVKDVYGRTGVWLMRRATIGAIRKLKDGQGNYLWQPGLAGGQPATLLDKPYIECVDMPAIAANAFPVAFGDFRRGYLIVDRTQMTVLRDPYSAKGTGTVEFMFTRRVAGQVVVAEAMRKLKIAA